MVLTIILTVRHVASDNMTRASPSCDQIEHLICFHIPGRRLQRTRFDLEIVNLGRYVEVCDILEKNVTPSRVFTATLLGVGAQPVPRTPYGFPPASGPMYSVASTTSVSYTHLTLPTILLV